MTDRINLRPLSCDVPGCPNPLTFRAYASYNADEGENAHPRHARYPMPMFRSCTDHLGALLISDAPSPTSTRQWLIVSPQFEARRRDAR